MNKSNGSHQTEIINPLNNAFGVQHEYHLADMLQL